MRDARKGSSPKYSKFRPFIGARLMFTPGASRKCTPLARESRPSSAPTSSASAGFHVAVSVTPPANAVAGPKLRTPTGPSAIFSRGKLRRGTSRMKKPSTPPSRSSFSSSVIWLRMESTRRATSAEERKEGAGACADAQNNVKKIKAVIEQNLCIEFFLFRVALCDFVDRVFAHRRRSTKSHEKSRNFKTLFCYSARAFETVANFCLRV